MVIPSTERGETGYRPPRRISWPGTYYIQPEDCPVHTSRDPATVGRSLKVNLVPRGYRGSRGFLSIFEYLAPNTEFPAHAIYAFPGEDPWRLGVRSNSEKPL